jgi:hypothetical protein
MISTDKSWPLIAKCVGYVVLVFFIAGLVATIFAPLVPEERWAVIDEDKLHAVWDPDTQTVLISLDIQKRQECHRVIVDKILRRIRDNEVDTKLIPLEGLLSDKIQRVPVGGSATIFDQAKPRMPVQPGHYLMVLSAFCELPQDDAEVPEEATTVVPVTPTTVRTLPVQAVLVISLDDDAIARQRAEKLARYWEQR